jgi:hypothetical protein
MFSDRFSYGEPFLFQPQYSPMLLSLNKKLIKEINERSIGDISRTLMVKILKKILSDRFLYEEYFLFQCHASPMLPTVNKTLIKFF